MDLATPLPTGTVTFLFTDIEGSTRLWEQQPEAMEQALAHHNALLHHAILAHGGRVFKTVGDQFCAVFARARDALDAAVAAQRALLDARFPFRVRVAVHTGEAQEREGDYFGPALNRVARLLTAAHGGQVLLSDATARTIGPPFSEELQLRVLGVHRLRDLAESEAIYQLLSPGLPSDFPPPNTLDVAFRRGMRRAAVIAAGVIAVLAGLALFANDQRQIAVRGQRTLRRHLYAAQMSVAQQAWNEGNVGRTQELVEAQRPRPGEEDLRGFEWRYLWRVCQGDIRFTLGGHQAAVTSVAFSPDGSMLASSGDDGTVKLRTMTTRQLVGTLAGQPGLLHVVRFSPDGKMLASGSSDGSIWLWDLASRRKRASIRASAYDIWHLTFAPDGQTLASISWSHTGPAWVELWDLPSGRAIARLRSRSVNMGRGAAFSPDGRLLVFQDAGVVKLWDRAATRIVATFAGPAAEINGLAFSPDGKTVAWGDENGTVGLWDAAAKREVARLRGHEALVEAVVFSPDGKSLATGSDDLSIRLWDLATKRERAVLRGHAQFICDLAFSPDGTLLASASADRTVKLWNAAPRRELETFGVRSQSGDLRRLAFSPDGRLLALGDGKKGVRLWEIATGRAVGALTRPGGESGPVAFSPDNRRLACGERDGKVTLWDLPSRHAIGELRGHRGPVAAIAFSPDGRLVASGLPGEVKVWEVPTRRLLAKLPEVDLIFIEFSPDGRLLAVGSPMERMVERWEVATWRRLPPLRAQSGWLEWQAALSPNGRLLASGTLEGNVYVWDIRTGRVVAMVQGHRMEVLSVAFSPDGKTLATGSGDGTVKLWNVATWQEVATFSRQRRDLAALGTGMVERAKGIVALAFSPDGDRLVSVSSDGRAWLWRAAPLRETDAPDGARIRPSSH